jgi:hypothetical protein
MNSLNSMIGATIIIKNKNEEQELKLLKHYAEIKLEKGSFYEVNAFNIYLIIF